jgi:hypothetical protein
LSSKSDLGGGIVPMVPGAEKTAEMLMRARRASIAVRFQQDNIGEET